ncbi:unnamed protein product [Adineta ricciae]|uniref:Uncharacterized protein n=1 Tax=Adineta ricciae TaxID=249248 RepID=A0A815QML4_ADIRI|nr:unnamed protein product [Adineta ricciae]CAF1465304.1 unnamed protein product [Adineta ricciae]
MLSWDNCNLNSGPLIIHLSDVDDIDATLDVVEFLRNKKIPLQWHTHGYICQYAPYRLIREFREQYPAYIRRTKLNRRSFWTLK